MIVLSKHWVAILSLWNLRRINKEACMDKSDLIKLYESATDDVKIIVVKILENSQQVPEPQE